MPDGTFYNLKKLHVVFAIASLALLGATVWMVVADYRRDWKVYQRTYRGQIEPRRDKEPLAIDQIWLPDLTVDYNFRQVARFDRCTTCHQGMTSPSVAGRPLPQPYSAHPRPDLFVGPHSPHPADSFGCTVCHRGQGSATDFQWTSHTPNDPARRDAWQKAHGWSRNSYWDYPMLAARFAETSCLQCHHDPNELAESDRFLDPPAPKLLAGYNLVREYGCFGCHEIKGIGPSGERIGPDMRLEPGDGSPAAGPSSDQQHPGSLRKVGPSLRHVAGKLDAAFIARWVAEPGALRPATRMPRLYGLHDHLEGKSLDEARRFEAVELQGIAQYLLNASQPLPPLPTPAGVTEPASAERGKRLFVMRGCAACHKHTDVPEAQSTTGPDLSNLGSKLTNAAGAQWLVEWIRNPSRYSPRTLMPNAMLGPEPLPEKEGPSKDGKSPPRMTDPAADIAAYLLASKGDKPAQLPPVVEKDLDELALLHLSKTYPKELAEKYLAEGILDRPAAQAPGEAAELLGPITAQKKLRYVGRRTIAKRGCFGCHDIPGFENAQPIGPALSDWGRKQESLLAFEQVHEFLDKSPDQGRAGQGGAAQDPTETEADRRFYTDAVRDQRREGFIWQKLRAPRSFDYKKAETKGYNEQLLMGKFNLTAAQREAIITFVLGLVAQPPQERYLPKPDARRRAIVEGRAVIDKYGCADCHTFRMERWSLAVDPQEFPPPADLPTYDFVLPRFTPEQLAASRKPDRQGRVHADIVGEPMMDPTGQVVQDEDDDGNPLFAFNLWEPALIGGQVWRVGGMQVPVPAPSITAKRPAWGGAYARLLYPRAIQDAGTGGVEAWSWVPPPLVHEGRHVQPAWLYSYLLNPAPIRPAAVLRMPKFNLSPAEAGKLVDYFAAVAGVEFPYSTEVLPEATTAEEERRRDAAMRLVTDRTTYCAKCHLIGDFTPGGETGTILGPNLEDVARRIRPEYLRRWLADPKSVLPYTGMPVNFPPQGPPMGQDLLPGPSGQQLDAVLDLLLHYDVYLKRQTSIRKRIEGGK